MEQEPKRTSKTWDARKGRYVCATPEEASAIAQISRPSSLDVPLNDIENGNGHHEETNLSQGLGQASLLEQVNIEPVN